jgi:putative addiction module component (TIGR02574 family)
LCDRAGEWLTDSAIVYPDSSTKFVAMSKAEILEQLPKLNSVDLREICDRIWQLEEEQLLSGRATPSDEEKALLDRELEDYSRDREAGSSWEDVKSRLKQ